MKTATKKWGGLIVWTICLISVGVVMNFTAGDSHDRMTCVFMMASVMSGVIAYHLGSKIADIINNYKAEKG